MKAIIDSADALTGGLAAIRADFQVPDEFPAHVLAAAAEAVKRPPNRHGDRTSEPFVTLDPATSTDLDQAFAIDRAGADLLLHYAIADVGWFVDDGDAIDAEAWRRGETLYLPDGKASLYPPALGERAASLLPDGPRPAVVFTTRVSPVGEVALAGAERAVIRSRAKLAYDRVTDADLPPDFPELAQRIQAAEQRRGAARVDPPEQEVEATGDGHYALRFRPRLVSEERNAAMSLATNLAVAAALQAAGTGLFRVMAEPDASAVARLRHTAHALKLNWRRAVSLSDFERTLSAADPRQAAMMMAIRRAGQPASYMAYHGGEQPWHAAMAASYVHATAPLRRLADRYVVRAALAVANGEPVPDVVTEAFERLPQVMARADALAGRIESAVRDLAEAEILQGQEGQTFGAVVTEVDERGARIQLEDHPVITRITVEAAAPGDMLRLRLTSADPASRRIVFEPV